MPACGFVDVSLVDQHYEFGRSIRHFRLFCTHFRNLFALRITIARASPNKKVRGFRLKKAAIEYEPKVKGHVKGCSAPTEAERTPATPQKPAVVDT